MKDTIKRDEGLMRGIKSELEDIKRHHEKLFRALAGVPESPKRKALLRQLEGMKMSAQETVEDFQKVCAELDDCRKSIAALPAPGRQILHFWELFKFILPPKTRTEVYEPLYNEFLEDYLVSRVYKSKYAKRWLKFCFVTRTGIMVAGCLRVSCSAKLRLAFLAFLPESLRRFWSS